MTNPTNTTPQLPAHLPPGTIVRRGNGKTLWCITGLVGGDLITLDPVTGYTGASIRLDQADRLTIVQEADETTTPDTSGDPAGFTAIRRAFFKILSADATRGTGAASLVFVPAMVTRLHRAAGVPAPQAVTR